MTDDANYATSIASWSMALAKGLRAYGIDPVGVFAAAGIDLTSVESPYSRFPVSRVQKVWRYAYENTDEFFGITVSQFLNPASFHALGFGLYASSTLKEMLERLIRYRCVISHKFFAELLKDGNYYVLTTADERIIKTNVTHDTLFGFILTVARQTSRPDFKPAKVTIGRIPPRNTAKLVEFLAAPTEFGAPASTIIFTKEDLETPLRCGDTGLAAKQDQLVEHYIAEFGLISENMLQVKTEISRLLESGEVSLHAVAENLHVTARTLQRRLKDENSSYNDLLDKIRHDLAMDYVKDTHISATQIAFKLGFNDSGSFARHFKRWTGQSISNFRNDL
ncbi:MAG: AraC family transcriptional regulator ligand-binding domain-containing protein [Pseudomonadales bacterium]